MTNFGASSPSFAVVLAHAGVDSKDKRCVAFAVNPLCCQFAPLMLSRLTLNRYPEALMALKYSKVTHARVCRHAIMAWRESLYRHAFNCILPTLPAHEREANLDSPQSRCWSGATDHTGFRKFVAKHLRNANCCCWSRGPVGEQPAG